MSFTPHVEWLEYPGNLRVHGIVRLFENPVAPEVGGMPGQAWVWCCNCELRGAEVTIRAATTAPPGGSLRPLLEVARSLGCRQLKWERLEGGAVRIMTFNL